MSESRSFPTGIFRSLLIGLAIGAAGSSAHAQPAGMRWRQLPPIPDVEGFAESFAGVSGAALVDRWAEAGELPISRATVPTPEVWSMEVR